MNKLFSTIRLRMVVPIILLLSTEASADIVTWRTPPLGFIWSVFGGVQELDKAGNLYPGLHLTESPNLAESCLPGWFLKETHLSAGGFILAGVCRTESVLADGTIQWAEKNAEPYYLNGICPQEGNDGFEFLPGNSFGLAACVHSRQDFEPDRKKNLGRPTCDLTGNTNPINISSGNKFESETDYSGSGLFPLLLARSYNSDVLLNVSFSSAGIGIKNRMSNWLHSYDRRISVGYDGLNAEVFRPTGTSVRFSLQSGVWVSDADVQDKLITLLAEDGVTVIGRRYISAADNITEEFDETGKLLTIADNHGNYQYLSYSDGYGGLLYSSVPSKSGYLAPACLPFDGTPPLMGSLACVTNSAGRALNFRYDSQQRIFQIVDPAGGAYTYAYGEESSIGAVAGTANLTSVTTPDGGKRQYWYNEPALTSGANLPFALTGITDENGNRSATWRYDGAGRAISSEHGGGTDRYNVNYNSSNHPTVTDASGVSKFSALQVVQGVSKNLGQSQPSGAGCSAASLSKTYDASGNVTTLVDFRGMLTTYTYDTNRNLETRRVEGDGTATPRIVSTQWHASLRLPTAIAEPKRIFKYEYDDVGNLLKKTQQNTLDETGTKGLLAQTAGPAKIWTYTYNPQGQVLSVRNPRTDLAVIQEYSYDSQGNLVAVKNPLGQVTTLSGYTEDGLVGRVSDANGVSTDYVYDARRHLVSTTSGGRSTNYAYDLAGNLVSVTRAGEAALELRYDDALRLTQIVAGDGASVNYSLDLYGNKIGETIVDSKGTLTRQIARVFDALNRLQQITGDVQ